MNPILVTEISLTIIITFTVTYLTVSPLIKLAYKREIVGIDLHKTYSTKIPRVGGLAILTGLLAGMTLAGLINIDNKTMFLIFFITILGGILGLTDDILGLNKKALTAFSILIGAPFLTYHTGSTIITLTPLGPADLGPYFWILALLGVAFLTNAVNIYAGFNGLEAGNALITSISLAISALTYSSKESAISLLILSATLTAFLKWNIYPAKIFIGNTGTYLTGALIASSIISGNIKVAGIIACTPYIANFILRAKDRFRWTVGTTNPDGKIQSESINALWSIFIHNHPRPEKTIVHLSWIIQATFGMLAITYSILRPIQ